MSATKRSALGGRNKKILASFIVVLSVSFGFSVFAQTPSTPPTPPSLESLENAQESVTLATVNFEDAKIISQNGSTINIEFEISNRENIQPGIKYAVTLEKKNADNTISTIDEKVYDESLTLQPGEKSSRTIDYSAPSYLSGTYTLKLISKNEKALPLALMTIGEVTFNGSNQLIQIDPASCFLKVENEQVDNKYTLSQGVDISVSENLIGTCDVTSSFKVSTNATPIFTTLYRDLFGREVSKTQQAVIVFNAGEKKTLNFKIPTEKNPQAYDAVLSFQDAQGNVISNQVKFHYVIQGESATLQNIRMDKDFYQAGDTANVKFFWSPSADNFPNSRNQGTKSEKNELEVKITSNGNNCSDPMKKEIGRDQGGLIIEFNIPIKKECVNPQFSASIIDGTGKTLDEANISLQSSNQDYQNSQLQKNQKTKELLKNIIIFFVVVIFILSVGLIVVKKKRGSIGMIVFFLFLSTLFLSNGNHAKADTFTANSGTDYYGSATYWVNVPSTVEAGKPMRIEGGIYAYSTCSNGDIYPGYLYAKHLESGNEIWLAYNTCSSTYKKCGFIPGFPQFCAMLCNGMTDSGAKKMDVTAPGPGNYKVPFYGFAPKSETTISSQGFDGTQATVYKVPYKVVCRSSSYGSWISNGAVVNPGEKFTAVCNYGAYTDAIDFVTGAAKCDWSGVWTDSWTGWSKTGAIFNCTAKDTPGTYNANCKIYATGDYCARTDSAGSITVQCVPDNSCIWNTCKTKKCDDGCGNPLEGQKDCSSHAFDDEVCNSRSIPYTPCESGGPCLRKCDDWCTMPGAKCSSGPWTFNCNGSWHENDISKRGSIEKVGCCRDTDCGGGSTCDLTYHQCTSFAKLRATPNPVAYGAESKLTWAARNFTGCWLSGDTIGNLSFDADNPVWEKWTGPLTAETNNYTLTCWNNNIPEGVPGRDSISKVTVNVSNERPAAVIDQPDADEKVFEKNANIPFSGHGEDRDGNIVAHMWYRDGQCQQDSATLIYSCPGNPTPVCKCEGSPMVCTSSGGNNSDCKVDPYDNSKSSFLGKFTTPLGSHSVFYRAKDNDGRLSPVEERTVNIVLPKYQVTVTVSGSGSVTSADTLLDCSGSSCSVSQEYNEGDSITLTATPDSGYMIKRPVWSGDVTNNNKEITVNINSNKTITANFESPGCEPRSIFCTLADSDKVCLDVPYINPDPICPGVYSCKGTKDCNLWREIGR